MADIFISYARADQSRIEKLSVALQEEGFDVWWDQHISGGSEFSAAIERALNAAKVIIVAWSKNSVDSMWVADEASLGREKGNLVPLLLDEAPPKLGFRQIQSLDFRKWKGSRDDPIFQSLKAVLNARIEGNSRPTVSPTVNKASIAMPKPAIIVAASALACRQLLLAVRSSLSPYNTTSQSMMRYWSRHERSG